MPKKLHPGLSGASSFHRPGKAVAWENHTGNGWNLMKAIDEYKSEKTIDSVFFWGHVFNYEVIAVVKFSSKSFFCQFFEMGFQPW